VADNLLAKHDENYVPRELQEMTEHQAREVVAETTDAGA
jgi:cytochrome c-type biogenesis protein CcmE